ncbi:hypothetical protein B0A54_08130 [Friedmanniomyces endolithicus]|uniref:Uncharacterized protein n=1 Tax=Friedmanniomyces endolithicus TaxID=329885 RepID=A0A4U0UZS0_9PEZI|nr:hypothetical protein LTS09_012711 [Friedmanniomyces endolithicus]TKA41704.1 hypothetical protein B0A54_08130 [Friedmanniomyces endolithicus]
MAPNHCHLISFKSCPHFTCTTAPMATDHILAYFASFSLHSLTKLSTIPITVHTVLPTECPLCADLPADPEHSAEDIRKAVEEMKTVLTFSRKRYENLGAMYHDFPFYVRAKTVKLRSTFLAHRQFGINIQSLAKDPFFRPLLGVEAKLTKIEEWLACETTIGSGEEQLVGETKTVSGEELEAVIEEVNAARCEYSGFVKDLLRLGKATLTVKHRGVGYAAEGRDRDTGLPTRGKMAMGAIRERFLARKRDSRRTVSPLASSSLLRSPRSPDTASHIYPDRAIRPLPRSRLKSRLSPEQVNGLIYPLDPPPIASPVLASSSGDTYERGPIVNGVRAVHAYANHIHAHEDSHYPHHRHDVDVGHCTCGEEGEVVDSGDEEVEFDHPDYRYTAATGTPTPAGYPGHVHEMVVAREMAAAGSKPPLDSVQRRLMEAARLDGGGKLPPPPGSTASSSADGYESFENTSNKKKRKIPLSGASSTLHQSSLSAEMASMGISGQHDGAADDGGPMAAQSQQVYTPSGVTAGSGTGISGAGRGRYGRAGNPNAQRNGLRRPLTNGTANMTGPSQQKGTLRANGDMTNGDGPEDFENTGGIISQAIKSAAEQGPLTPQKGASGKASPNQSLLQQSAAAASSNTTPKTQFTFHCDSESATKMVDQETAAATAYGHSVPAPSMPGAYPTALPGVGAAPEPGRMPNGQYTRVPNAAGNRVSTQGTQTTPSLRGGAPLPINNATRLPPPPVGGAALPAGQQQQHPGAPAAPLPPPKTKPRRRPSKEYALAARQRQLQQEYTNYHHRPTKDNMWICEFCEYEDIFGVPPMALIRSYEIKDRAERKKAAEKRRLLEKAKMKGRKNKKGSKKANAAAAAAKDANAAAYPATGGPGQPPNGVGGAPYDPHLRVPSGGGGLPPGPPGDDEYYDYEEGYDEEGFEGEEYEPVEGEYEDPYFAPPPPAPRGTPVQGGGGVHAQGVPVQQGRA